MMIPPIVVPWPPMNFVSEWITTSAPCWIGLSRNGVGTVLSAITGTPRLCATSATAARSMTLPAGLPTVSQKTALVRSSISAAIESG